MERSSAASARAKVEDVAAQRRQLRVEFRPGHAPSARYFGWIIAACLGA